MRRARRNAAIPAIVEPHLLLVEGRDEQGLLACLLDHIGLPSVQTIRYDGITNLRRYLRVLQADSRFPEVTAVGVLRDADASAERALQSVCDALSQVLGTPSIKAHAEFVQHGSLQTGAFILPDGQSPGMLEDLCLLPVRVSDDRAMRCVDEYIACLQGELGEDETQRALSKRRLQVFIASRPKPSLRIDIAAEAGYWHFEDPVWDPLKQFLRDLAGET
jgi:hypothetical protein